MTRDGRRDYGTVTPRVLAMLNAGWSTKIIGDNLHLEVNVVRAIAYRHGYVFVKAEGHWRQRRSGKGDF